MLFWRINICVKYSLLIKLFSNFTLSFLCIFTCDLLVICDLEENLEYIAKYLVVEEIHTSQVQKIYIFLNIFEQQYYHINRER
jgi:hypothetical protein